MKYSKGRKHKQSGSRAGKQQSRGRLPEMNTHSPSVSRESSHFLNYNYEEDTTSNGERSQAIETLGKLRWPIDKGAQHEGRLQKKNEENSARCNNAPLQKAESPRVDEEIGLQQGDESNEEDFEPNLHET